MIIRDAAEEDLAEIARIEEENFSEPWSLQGFRDALGLQDTARIFTAEDEKRHILGYLVLYYTRYEGELETIAVDKGWRGYGTGGMLVDAMLDFGRERDLDQIVLEVRESNAPAIALYTSRGFVTCGKRKNFYRFPREDALVMVHRYETVPAEEHEGQILPPGL